MENYRIVTLPSAKIREVTRVAMEGYWKQIILFMLFYYLITTGVSCVLDLFFVTVQQVPLADTGEYISQVVYYGSSIYEFLIGGPVAWAMSKFLLDFFRYQKVEYTTLFEGFSHFGRTFLLMLLMSVKIFLWSLLLVVPGIIASFRYSQAYYIMVDHPEYRLNQCIQESCRMMKGNKMKYFCLNLSFIGWNILCSLPAVLFADAVAQAEGITFVLLSLVLSLPVIFVNAYLNMALTVLYELMIDNLTIVDHESREVNNGNENGNWDASMYSAPAPEETLVHELPTQEENRDESAAEDKE